MFTLFAIFYPLELILNTTALW